MNTLKNNNYNNCNCKILNVSVPVTVVLKKVQNA